ncbi:chemotaxis protein CheB [Pseudomonas sp. F1_0610]|uniref:chemotaxis protein CheB n=1 Tax=Pseudomonas sp. F1_0610 TaxID=3114284 RepID=UPI0039C21DA5
MSNLRVAVVVDQPEKMPLIQNVLALHGYQVVLNEHIAELEDATVMACKTDLWLLAISEDVDLPILDTLLDQNEAPVLMGEGRLCSDLKDNFALAGTYLYKKVEQAIGRSALEREYDFSAISLTQSQLLTKPTNLPTEHNVWLLVGDKGAIPAVTEFLASLPANLPLTFIYVQHMLNAPEELQKFLQPHIQMPVEVLTTGEVLATGQVLIAPPTPIFSLQGGQVHFDQHLNTVSNYIPSASAAMKAVAQEYTQASGVIFFSGLGLDGADSLLYAKRQGMQIWIQDPATSQVDFVPNYINSTGLTSFSGTPLALAEQLLTHLNTAA